MSAARAVSRLVIGNPENRRITLFQEALKRCGLPPAGVLAYEELLQSRDFTPLQGASRIRIESPGENFTVEKQLIALGAGGPTRCGERISALAALSLPSDHGRLRLLQQWYVGFGRLLGQLDESTPDSPAAFVNSPADIALLFDKRACQQKLAERNVSIPPHLHSVHDFESLLAAAKREGWKRVFIKPSHSSSAAGVVALHILDDGFRATTSVEMELGDEDVRFYNNLQLTVYQDVETISALVDFLFREGAHAERWLPKALIDGANFDLRVVVIAGEPQHVVVRVSRGPLTNLHLGNKRGDLERLREAMGQDRWLEVLQVCRRAARCFPKSHYLGIDVLVEPGFRRPTVLEVNAFGDLLPGVVHKGYDTYEAELRAESRADV